MKGRLNYRELIKNWMQFYGMTAETAKKMFASIWARMQASKLKTLEKGEETNGTFVERADTAGES